MRNGEHEKTKL